MKNVVKQSMICCCLLAVASLFVTEAAATQAIEELTKENFNKIITSAEKNVVVLFYTPWSGHCKKFAPEFTRVAADFQTKPEYHFARVNGYEQQELGAAHNIKKYPSVVYFPKSNKKGEHYKGSLSKSDLAKYLTSYQFLDTVTMDRKQQAIKMEDEIAQYEEAHGHHLLDRPHVSFEGGTISISESFTVSGPMEMRELMGEESQEDDPASWFKF